MTRTTLSSRNSFVPDWPAPGNVRSLITTRHGGVSQGCFSSLNLGDHVGDDLIAVQANRAILGELIAASPVWLNQVHGTCVVEAAKVGTDDTPSADTLFREAGVGCVVMTADCLPVLFAMIPGVSWRRRMLLAWVIVRGA